MKYFPKLLLIIILILLSGFKFFDKSVKETEKEFIINKDATLSVILQTPLSSNTNKAGDRFITKLKKPLVYKEKIILPENMQILGELKKVIKYEKFGDKAVLYLMFDKAVLPDGKQLIIKASLDSNKGIEVIKIKGKLLKDASIVVGSGVVGTMVGKSTLGKDGDKKGGVVGVGVGMGAVVLSDRKEIKLPKETELIIKLDEDLMIPKK